MRFREDRRDEGHRHAVRIHAAPARILGQDVGGAGEHAAFDEQGRDIVGAGIVDAEGDFPVGLAAPEFADAIEVALEGFLRSSIPAADP